MTIIIIMLRNMKCLDYASTAEAAFLSAGGVWARYSLHVKIIINTFLCLSQTGYTAVYILFVAQNIQHVRLSFNIEIEIFLD